MTTPAPPGTRLSALVVNYNSGAFAESCVYSLQREWRLAGRDARDLEVVVVDNASPLDQREWLARLVARGATVIESATNDGYSGGTNRAFAHTSGGPRDVVGVLNPDLFFTPGSVEELMGYVLAHDDCGVVDPRTTVDPGFVLHLPRNPLPTPLQHLGQELARMSPLACRAYSRWRMRRAVPWWTAAEPVDARMLSGCCLFLRREVAEELPALLDERFPLYFEDTDLFRSLAARGYRVVHLSSARVLHHWSRSAGLGVSFEGETMRRHAIAQRAYYEKYYGRLGAAFVRLVDRCVARWPVAWRDRPMHRIAALGATGAPIVVPLPRRCPFVIEVGVQPTFLLAAGVVGEGERWECPPLAWEWFFEGRYYLRAIALDTLELLGCYSFDKTTPGRNDPLAPGEEQRVFAATSAAREGAA